jgi:hypothetical protein
VPHRAFASRNHSAVRNDRPPNRGLEIGRATVLGRRNLAHRTGHSPHTTSRRSGTTALLIKGWKLGEATVLGRRNVAYREGHSPYGTTRRSGTTALPIAGRTLEGQPSSVAAMLRTAKGIRLMEPLGGRGRPPSRLRGEHWVGDRPRSPGCCVQHRAFASRNHSAVEDDRPPDHGARISREPRRGMLRRLRSARVGWLPDG